LTNEVKRYILITVNSKGAVNHLGSQCLFYFLDYNL